MMVLVIWEAFVFVFPGFLTQEEVSSSSLEAAGSVGIMTAFLEALEINA